MKRIALFASGSGSNVENIARYFASNTEVEIVGVFCNKPNAYVLERAKKLSIPSKVFNREEFYDSDTLIQELVGLKTDLVVLAGFLWLVPSNLVEAFPNKIINVHPALLPNYGGKGMYGMNVHKAVKANNEQKTGITIHYVNENYDEGNIIFQAECKVAPNHTPEDIAASVHQLEYQHFPAVVEQVLATL